MKILFANIKKDFLILLRDKVGLAFMFALPVLLVVVITSIQHSTFQLVNENKIKTVLINLDGGEVAADFVEALDQLGMFELYTSESLDEKNIQAQMDEVEALITILIPKNFSSGIESKSEQIASKALSDLGLEDAIAFESEIEENNGQAALPLKLYYNPVLQESFRRSIQGSLRGSLQIVENENLVSRLYEEMSEGENNGQLTEQLAGNPIQIEEIPVSFDGRGSIPNATQHNVPAWTIFAMFFMVMSLGSNIVHEKVTGSFIRLKIMPASFIYSLFSKQFVYLVVALSQIAFIFSLGVWLFPLMNLPKLNIPSDLSALFLVSVFTGWCAVSYAMTLGVFSKTLHQVNGFGAVSVVILAAIGGIMVPIFAMPATLKIAANFSPLYWCLESYYALFLSGGGIAEVFTNILPLTAIIAVLQLASIAALKRQNLI